MTSSDHISRQFDADLEAIRASVLQMGGMVETRSRARSNRSSAGMLR